MTRKKLEIFVKDRFGMNHCKFIKHKCEDESLFDCEVADLLRVSSSFIAKLTHLFEFYGQMLKISLVLEFLKI